MAEINVTPLVDVMMVLLVIFMVTAPLLKAGIAIDLPDSRAKPLTATPRGVTVTIDRDGKTWLDDAELAPGALAARIAALPRGADGRLPQVTLRADRALDYGRVAALMGELNRAGVTELALVTGAGLPRPAGGVIRGSVSAH
ncbi:MAG: ExbD/TolR family protein [Sphingomonadales bacterium]|nr:ExbD/TolR family protein [Sphingomonadales bacterium]